MSKLFLCLAIIFTCLGLGCKKDSIQRDYLDSTYIEREIKKLVGDFEFEKEMGIGRHTITYGNKEVSFWHFYIKHQLTQQKEIKNISRSDIVVIWGYLNKTSDDFYIIDEKDKPAVINKCKAFLNYKKRIYNAEIYIFFQKKKARRII